MSTVLAYVDTETTGLDARIHQPYELCIWREDAEHPITWRLPHTLEYADPFALTVGNYYEREFYPFGSPMGRAGIASQLIPQLRGVTLVGSNPAFDARMLEQFIGTSVWHYRFINVAEYAMAVFDWDRPEGIAKITEMLLSMGYEIPAPDHTAEGDVRTTRAAYEALREIRRERIPAIKVDA